MYDILCNWPEYKVSPKDRESLPENKFITFTLLRLAVDKTYPDGMERNASRIWAHIMDTLYDAPDSLSLTKDQFMWLYEIIDRVELQAGLSSWLWTFRDYLETLKKSGE